MRVTWPPTVSRHDYVITRLGYYDISNDPISPNDTVNKYVRTDPTGEFAFRTMTPVNFVKTVVASFFFFVYFFRVSFSKDSNDVVQW